jgi:hypothetical protein
MPLLMQTVAQMAHVLIVARPNQSYRSVNNPERFAPEHLRPVEPRRCPLVTIADSSNDMVLTILYVPAI